MKAALAKAVEWGVLEVSPLAKLKPYKVDRLPKVRYLAPEEEKRLRAALEARDDELKDKRRQGNGWRQARGYALLPSLDGQPFGDYLTPLVTLAKHTGLRRGELFALKWAHVDFTRHQVSVHGAQSKSGQTRHIPLNREARAALVAWRRQAPQTALVFPGDDGAMLTNVKKAWGGLCRRARLEGFRFHDLRHDFASKLVMAGVPLNTVRELLGHSDLQTTLRYAHLAPAHKAEAVEMLA
jgi:integrase